MRIRPSRTITQSAVLAFAALIFTATAQVVDYMPAFHPRYKHITTIPGLILDAREGAILFQDADNVIGSFDLASQTITTIFTNTLALGPAFLTPTGAFVLGTDALQIDAGEQIALGSQYSFADFPDHMIDGRFGILRTTNGLVLRDFVARTNCLISTTLGFGLTSTMLGFTDVAPNGAVVFTVAIDETNKAIRWFQNGETKTLSVVPMYEYPYVATDGTNILWSEHHAPFGQQYPFGSIFLQTASGEKIEIATNTSVFSYQSIRGEMPPYPPAAVKNGWVVFPRNSLTQATLWRRAPDGSINQLTATPSPVLAMRDDGGVLVSGGSLSTDYGLYYVPATGPEKRIDGVAAKYFASGDKFYAYGFTEGHVGEGTFVYEIEVEQDPFGVIYPTYNSETQTFSFGLIPGATGDYELQRTTDFITWTSISTTTVTNTYSLEIQVATQPGYFRVHKL